jgi:putative transposase
MGLAKPARACGTHTGKKKLSERVHVCHECGYITDRDVAAAMVVELLGLAAAGLAVKLPVEVSLSGPSV